MVDITAKEDRVVELSVKEGDEENTTTVVGLTQAEVEKRKEEFIEIHGLDQF